MESIFFFLYLFSESKHGYEYVKLKFGIQEGLSMQSEWDIFGFGLRCQSYEALVSFACLN